MSEPFSFPFSPSPCGKNKKKNKKTACNVQLVILTYHFRLSMAFGVIDASLSCELHPHIFQERLVLGQDESD